MKRIFACALVFVCLFELQAFAVGGKKALYVGGTVNNLPEKAKAILDTTGPEKLSFANGYWKLPYKQITSLEYGPKTGGRVAVPLLINPIALFSKKRRHFLTINFKDDMGMDQAVVFELGKSVVRTTLTIIETRSGRNIEYQDERARKAGRGGN